MPKIRVEIDVPDGERCEGCDKYWKYSRFCELFKNENGVGIDIVDDRRLPQCIAAEVKEKS